MKKNNNKNNKIKNTRAPFQKAALMKTQLCLKQAPDHDCMISL